MGFSSSGNTTFGCSYRTRGSYTWVHRVVAGQKLFILSSIFGYIWSLDITDVADKSVHDYF